MNEPDEQEPTGEETEVVDPAEEAGFSTVIRGYDKVEVDRHIAALTDRLQKTQAAGDDAWGSGAVKRELERVGESTKSILTAAEETARKLLEDTSREIAEAKAAATEQAEKLRGEAEEFAAQTREDVEEEVRRRRTDANTQVEKSLADAEAKAEEVIEAALERRRILDARIEKLVERRDRVVDHLTRLSEQLSLMATAARQDSAEAKDDERTWAKTAPAELEVEAAPTARRGTPPLGHETELDDEPDEDFDDDAEPGEDFDEETEPDEDFDEETDADATGESSPTAGRFRRSGRART